MYTEYGFTIPENETITFKVSGNPTTGYEWHYVETENGAAFDVVEDYIMDPVPEGHEDYTGIGGTYYFTLSASQEAEKGNSSWFTISESRDWEEYDIQSYTFPIYIG